ncbi:hypothetical protein Droror1_Dr00025016 [Drosera rotundifolia]
MGRSSTRGGRGKGRSSVRIHIGRSPPPSIIAPVTAATPDVPVVPALGAMPATLSARGGRGKGRSSVGIHIQEQTTPPSSIAAPATAATPDVPVVPAVGATRATLSARGGRGKGASLGDIHIQEQTTLPPSIAAPATAAMPDVHVVGATPAATLSARGERGKGPSSGDIHIQEQTTPPPSIGVATPAPVFTPTTAVGFTTPIVPAHASTSAALDPISSSVGQIRVSPGSQPSSSRGPSSLPQLFVGPRGQYVRIVMMIPGLLDSFSRDQQMHEYGELAKLVEDNLKRNVGTSEVYVATHNKNDKFNSKEAEKIYPKKVGFFLDDGEERELWKLMELMEGLLMGLRI